MEKCSNYSNISDISNTLYIEGEYNIQKDYIDEESLKNISWIDSVEQEITCDNNIKTFVHIPKNEHNIEIDDIFSSEYKKLSDLCILEYQILIINYIRKQLKCQDDIKLNPDDILSKLGWLLNTSNYLSDKIGLQQFHHKNSCPDQVARSSYKFCNYNFECQFNYNVKKHNGCFAQHYVHNLVYADIESVINYMINNRLSICYDEIRKSINTISFVIGHMYEELKNAEKFSFFNGINFHIDRTPKKKDRINKITTLP
jgi:hypothetical protein